MKLERSGWPPSPPRCACRHGYGAAGEKNLRCSLQRLSRERRHRRGRNARHLRLREIRNGWDRDLGNRGKLGDLRQTGRRRRWRGGGGGGGGGGRGGGRVGGARGGG